MWKKRKAQRSAQQEAAPQMNWMAQFREQELQKEAEEVANAEDDAEKQLVLSEAAKHAEDYRYMMSNFMNMKNQTASNIISNMRS
jgi:hypothetical protein